MIDFGKILKRAWHILWSYKILWAFGILLAITTGGGSGSSPQVSYQFNGRDWQDVRLQGNEPVFIHDLNHWFKDNVVPLFASEQQAIHTWIWIGVGVLVFIIVVAVIMAFIRYPSETAVIRMVDAYEQTGEKVGFKQGWKMGWSRAAFRLWLIDLIVNLPVILLLAVLVGVGFAIYFSVESGAEWTTITGIIASVGCLFLFLFVFTLGMVFLGLLRQFFFRTAALENCGVRDSFRKGWQTFRQNWQSAGVMWLIMIGLKIGFAIAFLFLLIPLLIVCLIPAVVGIIAAAIPGLLLGGIVSLFSPLWVAILVGALIFLPIFALIAGSPFTLIGGWVKIFESSIWTLTYREMKSLESMT